MSTLPCLILLPTITVPPLASAVRLIFEISGKFFRTGIIRKVLTSRGRISQELAKVNINTFDHPTKGLDTFDSYLTTYNKIAQFVADSKSSAPVTKNRNLRTVYRMELDDSDGYESDYCKLQGYILI